MQQITHLGEIVLTSSSGRSSMRADRSVDVGFNLRMQHRVIDQCLGMHLSHAKAARFCEKLRSPLRDQISVASNDLLPEIWSEFGEKFPVRFGVRRTRESVDEDVEF